MHHEFSKVCVVGLGYIGLPTAAVVSRQGLSVVGVDIDPNIVSTINAGKIHIVENDLDLAVAEAVASGRLRAQSEPCSADVFMIAVPTPLRKGKNRIWLTSSRRQKRLRRILAKARSWFWNPPLRLERAKMSAGLWRSFGPI